MIRFMVEHLHVMLWEGGYCRNGDKNIFCFPIGDMWIVFIMPEAAVRGIAVRTIGVTHRLFLLAFSDVVRPTNSGGKSEADEHLAHPSRIQSVHPEQRRGLRAPQAIGGFGGEGVEHQAFLGGKRHLGVESRRVCVRCPLLWGLVWGRRVGRDQPEHGGLWWCGHGEGSFLVVPIAHDGRNGITHRPTVPRWVNGNPQSLCEGGLLLTRRIVS